MADTWWSTVFFDKEELRSDLAVAQAFAHESEHVQLPGGQPGRIAPGRRPGPDTHASDAAFAQRPCDPRSRP